MMAIYSMYIVSKSGGMIFNYDHNYPKVEFEKTFSYPLEIKMDIRNKKHIVVFGGTRESISAGLTLLGINGKIVIEGPCFEDGSSTEEYLNNQGNYPIKLRFGRTRMTTNEKMFLGSMFYPLYAIASQISPEPHCSGIQLLEAESFKLNCFQTLTGVKFILITDPKMIGIDAILKRIYELYSDYVLKNPFYALEMPIRCDLFLENLKNLFETVERIGA